MGFTTGGVALDADQKAALKAAMTDLGYSKPISSVSVSAQSHKDIILPTGFVAFPMSIFGLTLGSVETLLFIVSPDGGSTWYNDTVNSNSYNRMEFFNEGDVDIAGGDSNAGSDQGATGLLSAAAIDTSSLNGVIYPARMDILITPGAVSHAFSCTSNFLHVDSQVAQSPGHMGFMQGRVDNFLNANGRQNLFRIAPFGTEDLTNPDAGHVFSAEAIVLWGIPSP